MAYDRNAAKKQMAKRQQERAEKASSSGFIGVLKDKLPVWKVGEGKHKFDILPYVVGSKHPTLEKGKYDYMLDVYLHQNVGPDNAQYLCLQEMYGENCPICNYRAELQMEGEADKDKLKQLRAKHYGLYNIVCRDSSEQVQKGVQLLFINTFNMEDRLRELADDDSGEPILYPDVEEGKTISFKRTGTGKDNTRYTAHAFLERESKIKDSLLEKVFTLDECIVIPTEEEVERAFFGGLKKSSTNKPDDGGDDDGGDDDAQLPSDDDIEEMTRKELKNLISDLDLDIDPSDYDEKEDLIKDIQKAVNKLAKKSKKGSDDDVPESKGNDIPSEDELDEMSRKELKTVIRDFDLDIDPDDEDYEEKEELCKAVSKALKKLSSPKKKSKDDDDDGDGEKKKSKDDDDDGDGEKKKSKGNKCPMKDGTFGKDFDKFPECVDECKYFDECSDAYDELKKEKKATKLNKRK